MKTRFIFNEVIDRLKKVLKINHDYEVAERLNMKPGAFNARKKSDSLPYEEILLLAELEKLDYNWLLTGEGTMLKNSGVIEISGMNIKQKALFEGYNYLSEQQQDEVLAVISEKKRINDLEMAVKTMQGKM